VDDRDLETPDGALQGESQQQEKFKLHLKLGGVEFIDENGGGPGVRLRKRLKNRKTRLGLVSVS